MYIYIAKRLVFAVLSLLAILTIIFFVVRILPGDPATVILGDLATPAAVQTLQEQLGLNHPLHVQYFLFMRDALTGNLGNSMMTAMPVSSMVLSVLPHTIALTISALFIGCVVGIPLGIIAALRRNRFADYLTRVVSLIGVSLPSFVSAIILLLAFAVKVRWFPVVGSAATNPLAQLHALVLPAASLGLIMVAYVTGVTRSAMLDILQEDFVRTAKAKGMPPRVVIYRHALRNALMPVITVVGLYLGVLMGNSVLTEVVFNRPGIGKLIVGAISQRDYTLLQGCMVVVTMLFIGANLITDIVYRLLDPRVRYDS